MSIIMRVVCYYFCCSGSLLFFHEVPQVERESGAEGEEIGDSQEPLRILL